MAVAKVHCKALVY